MGRNSARSFLVLGLLAGLLAGLAAFAVARQVGEPHVESAIALEAGHHEAGHEDDAVEVSRGTQRSWGLLTGSLAVGVALGGIVALAAAALTGRVGRLRPGPSVALVSVVGFVSYALVPFLTYPATPPGVGSGETIGERTGLYFGFMLVSVGAAVAATYVALRVRERRGSYPGLLVGVAGYLFVVVVASRFFADVEEVGDFPAALLWNFRIASLLTLAALWGTLGVALTGLMLRQQAQDDAVAERRALAASL